jgi:hypothetical protein
VCTWSILFLTCTVSLHVHLQLYSKMKRNWNCFLPTNINSSWGWQFSSCTVLCSVMQKKKCHSLMIMMAKITGNAFPYNPQHRLCVL